MKRPGAWAVLIAGYLAVALAYALATPPLEASDEFKHYPVVQHIQTHGALPVLDPDSPGRWLQEAAQPPLYYVLMAGLTSWIDTSDLLEVHQINPHAFIGDPNQVGNKNLIIHTPERETFPWRGTVLAIYVARLATIGLGVATLLVIRELGGRLFDARVAWLAAALTAFNPMFLFVHAAVNNDALAILLGHLGLWQLVRIWQDKPDPRRRPQPYLLLGLIGGLGLLTKLSLGGLLALAGLALLWRAWHERRPAFLITGAAAVALPALIVVAPWLARNWQLYGDPTALNVFVAVQGTRDEPITWADWRGEFGTFFRSFWGLFGGVNVAAPQAFYWLANALALVATAGFAVRLRRAGAAAALDSGVWLIVAWPAVLLALLIRWNITSPAFQGRLIFPALGAINIIWAAGLLALVRPARQKMLARGVALVALLVAALLPWTAIRPAYAYPEPLAAVPAGARFGPISFAAEGGPIELAGVEVPAGQSVTPGGGPVTVVLYWRATRPVAADYVSSVHLLGRENRSVGQVDRYPAGGMVPTSRWASGQIWRDEYRIRAHADARAPGRLQVAVSLYDGAARPLRPLTARAPDGSEIALLVVGEARLAAMAPDPRVPPEPLAVELADGIGFRGYGLDPAAAAPGGQLAITLYWAATGRPSDDYTVFVHLLAPDGALLATADGPPAAGDYPTRMWRPGDQIADEHVLTVPPGLPAGSYTLSVGMYVPESQVRLARLDGAGDAISWPLEVAAAE